MDKQDEKKYLTAELIIQQWRTETDSKNINLQTEYEWTLQIHTHTLEWNLCRDKPEDSEHVFNNTPTKAIWEVIHAVTSQKMLNCWLA